jgi:nicotinate-nucleotide--dimethylbenzimidazole phosphoribosyltransferase
LSTQGDTEGEKWFALALTNHPFIHKLSWLRDKTFGRGLKIIRVLLLSFTVRRNGMEKFHSTLKAIQPLDRSNQAAVQHKLDQLTKPQGSLGRLEELALQYALISGTSEPKLRDKLVVVMAADHGIAAEGVSAFPREVTRQMVLNFLSGGAGINVLARHTGTRVIVVDIGVAAELAEHPRLLSRKVAPGTKNMLKEAAMTREQAVQAIEAGMAVVEGEKEKGLDILATGEMGIGNTTPSSAITAVLTGQPVASVTGRGTGIDDRALRHKIEVIERAIANNAPSASDPLDTLAKLGGLEIAGLVGVILAGAAYRLPVVLDGFISGAAALVAYKLNPEVKDYLIAAHCSVETGHKVILEHLGLNPLLDFKLRLGEGTGAVLGISLVEAGVKILTQMASFEDAGVSQGTTA